MSTLNYLVIDLETSIKNRGETAIGKNKGSPFHDDNKIVMLGYKLSRLEHVIVERNLRFPEDWFKGVDWVVGHNIKFDILYLMRYAPTAWNNFIKSGGRIWDTQLAEYLISGQTNLYASLDDLSMEYGGTLKDEKIKEYWNNCIDTEDIPEDELSDYLIQDVLNTEKIFLKQVHTIYELNPKLLDHVKMEMEALLATTEMEFNGMCFDKELANSYSNRLELDRTCLAKDIYLAMDKYFPAWYQQSPTSNEDISKMLFGGMVKGTIDKPMVDDDGITLKYKSGKRKGEIRYKKQEVEHAVTGFLLPVQDEWRNKKPGVYQVNDGVLLKIKGQFTEEVDEFIDLVLKFRKVGKEISTYFEGYSKLVWPDGGIHQSLNHCSTITGRLSCSSPNLQNCTNRS